MNAKEYLAQIVQKLQLLDDLGEEPSSLRIIEHMNLAVAFYRLHKIEHGIEYLWNISTVRKVSVIIFFCRKQTRPVHSMNFLSRA